MSPVILGAIWLAFVTGCFLVGFRTKGKVKDHEPR